MKTWLLILVVTVFAIIALADIAHDVITTDAVHYFAEQPHRLLLVAAVAIAGGLSALVFDRLSPRVQRRVKLFTVGSVASCLTVFTGYFLFEFVRLSSEFHLSDGGRALILVPLCLGLVVALLWLEVFHVFKGPVV